MEMVETSLVERVSREVRRDFLLARFCAASHLLKLSAIRFYCIFVTGILCSMSIAVCGVRFLRENFC